MLLDVIDSPFEIDTAVNRGRRWALLWNGNTCVGPFDSVDEAIETIEEMDQESKFVE